MSEAFILPVFLLPVPVRDVCRMDNAHNGHLVESENEEGKRKRKASMSKIKHYNSFHASLEKRTLTLSCVGGADPSSRIASTAAMILCSMYRHYYCSPATRIFFLPLYN